MSFQTGTIVCVTSMAGLFSNRILLKIIFLNKTYHAEQKDCFATIKYL